MTVKILDHEKKEVDLEKELVDIKAMIFFSPNALNQIDLMEKVNEVISMVQGVKPIARSKWNANEDIFCNMESQYFQNESDKQDVLESIEF